MKKTGIVYLLLLAVACSLLLTGCGGMTLYSNYIELEDLNLIKTVGVDGTAEGVRVTASTGLGLNGSAPKIYVSEGKTLSQALNSLRHAQIGKEIIFSHIENIIIGEKNSDGIIGECVDFLVRSVSIRLDSRMLIVRGGTAQELVMSTAGQNTSASDMIETMNKNIQRLSEGYIFTCLDIAILLENTGRAVIMAVRVIDSDELSEGAPEKMISPDGFGIIKDGRLTGFAERDEAKGVCILMNRAKAGNITVENDFGDIVTLGITSVRTEYEPEFDDGGRLIRVYVNIKAAGNIVEGVTEEKGDGADYKSGVADAFSRQILEAAESALRSSVMADIDYMEIGKQAEIKAPVKFKKMDSDWQDIFSDTEFRIKVESTVKRTYDTDEPLNLSGEENI